MELPKINLSRLLTFYVVASERNFTTAAKKIFVSESAISQQIRNLEKTAGVSLVYIRNKRVYLTEAGQMLLKYAEDVYKAAMKAQNFLGQMENSVLRIGVSTSLLSVVVPITAQYQQLYPGIKLSIRSGATRIVISQLLDLQLDVALVIRTNYGSANLNVTEISDSQRFMLMTDWYNPIRQNDHLRLHDLLDQTFIIPREESASREILMQRFQEEGIRPLNYTTIQIGYHQCAKMLAEMGKGVALLPEYEARHEIMERRLRELRLEKEIRFAVDALVVANTPESKWVRTFIKMAKKAFEKSPVESKV